MKIAHIKKEIVQTEQNKTNFI